VAETARWRGLYRFVYSSALIKLVEYAHDNPQPEFEFGPMNLHAMSQTGLTVTGSDLSGVRSVLSTVHGLSEVPA
jgi:hypothetical protein